jgi:hypothetical protein
MIEKLFMWGFMQNAWAWFHILFGGLGARLFSYFMDDTNALLLLFAVAVLWEVIEFLAGGGKQGMIDVYGTLERWFYDSLGDVIGAVLMAIIVLM